MAVAPLGIYYRIAERVINEIRWTEILGIQKDVDELYAIIELNDSQFSIGITCVFQNRSSRDVFVALANERLTERRGNPGKTKV